jgi:signal transduction histidine kinase
VALPLVHRGLRQGELRAAPRAGEDDVHPRDRDLLERIASQAAASAHGIRLDLQLQRSRERIVTAREEERRRLRRDLHDGLGPSLASLRLKLTALRRTLPADPDAARRIDELRDDLGTLVGDVRGLVYGLRPPALDDLGLTDALRELAYELERAGLDVSVAAEPVELPAAAEVAVYRIAQEALANVLRHAQAGRCELAVTISDGQVRVTVSDDGVGVPEKPKLGVGLRSMEERATELGGSFELVRLEPGCRIVATLPLEVRDG